MVILYSYCKRLPEGISINIPVVSNENPMTNPVTLVYQEGIYIYIYTHTHIYIYMYVNTCIHIIRISHQSLAAGRSESEEEKQSHLRLGGSGRDHGHRKRQSQPCMMYIYIYIGNIHGIILIGTYYCLYLRILEHTWVDALEHVLSRILGIIMIIPYISLLLCFHMSWE